VTVRASVLVPCHDKAGTLPLTVDTVLRQTVHEVEVLLVGDGVTDEVRDVITGLVASDERVRFLDFPKGPHHGEVHRHEAIVAAASDAIFYLCDDDLLLPEHVADLLVLLESATFVQSLNGYARADGRISAYAGDLADASLVAELLSDDIRFNFVSLTGTAHSRAFYLAVGEPWQTTPEGQWPDHHQWRRMMADPRFRGATSSRMTALQLPTSSDGREAWDDGRRLAELERWYRLVTGPDGQAWVDATMRDGLRLQLADADVALTRARTQLDGSLAETARLRAELQQEQVHGGRLRADLDDALAEVAALRASRSWRVTAPFRWCGTRLRALRAGAVRRGTGHDPLGPAA
jgi:hypothetical protein